MKPQGGVTIICSKEKPSLSHYDWQVQQLPKFLIMSMLQIQFEI